MISKTGFGSPPDGKSVERYTLCNRQGISAKIMTCSQITVHTISANESLVK